MALNDHLEMDEKADLSGHSVMDGATWHFSYAFGYREPRFQVPAIPLEVVYPDGGVRGYEAMVYIDDVSDPDDPQMVCAWDFYSGPCCIGRRGEYTRTSPR